MTQNRPIVYKYRAKKGPEEIKEGTIEAQSEAEAIDKLNDMGYVPISIKEESFLSEEAKPVERHGTGRIKSREITVFSRQLASLMRSGVPILSAINTLSEQSENPAVKDMLCVIRDSIKGGESLSYVLSQYTKIFPPLYIAMVRAGENSGHLPEALLRISEHRTKDEDFLSRFRMALAYPMLMAIVGLSTIFFMLTFVMPRLMKIYADMQQNLPLPTVILIAISKGLHKWWLIIIIAIVGAVFIIRKYIRTPAGKLQFSAFSMKIPLIGNLMLKAELSRFSRTLELLVKSGIPILKALEISIPIIDNELIKNQLKASYKELEDGGSLGRSLKDSKLFPLFMANLVIVGEESGRLDEALGELAASYERDTDEAMKTAASLLEPLMILIIGVVVGYIVISMLLPIFEINVMVR